MSGMRQNKLVFVLIVFLLTLVAFTGCEIFDPDDDSDDDRLPIATNTPVPTATPDATATPFQPRNGFWSGSALTWSFNASVPGMIQIEVTPDIFSGTGSIWVNDTYTADGGGPFNMDVAFNGTCDGKSIKASADRYNYREVFYSFYLEGYFNDSEHAEGIWSCKGAVPTDADWDDWGTWTAEFSHD
ncbi:hypothetical protein JW823_09735 [bacterium]|nr:hypothetical protein [candidate division CSSED10-310 bacterium]